MNEELEGLIKEKIIENESLRIDLIRATKTGKN
jgi:hypothetical protein